MSNIQILEEKLAFSKSLQQAVLGHMMTDTQFCIKAKEHLRPGYFATNELSEMYSGIVAFHEKFSALPHPEPLADFMLSLFKKDYRRDLHDCAAISTKYPLAQITKGLTDWIRGGIFKVHVEEAMKFYKNQQSEEFIGIMKQFLQKSRDVNLEQDVSYELGHFRSDFEESMSQAHSDLTTGISEFDTALGGGLIRGEHTVLLAPLNIGKTTTLLNFIVHNIKRGKHCLLLTHEGRPQDIVNKVRQRMLAKTREEIFEGLRTNNRIITESMDIIEKKLQKYFCYIPYNKAGSLLVENVVDVIHSKMEQLKSTEGKYYDLICDDYPGKLLSKSVGGFKEFRHSAKYCYDQFQQLALEYNAHAISPVQSNREGLKQNANRKDDDFLDAGVINESLGIAQDASNIISLNRSLDDRKRHIMHYHVVKTRQGPTDITFTTNTNFSKGITHDEELGYQVKSNDNNHLQKERVEQILGVKHGTEEVKN